MKTYDINTKYWNGPVTLKFQQYSNGRRAVSLVTPDGEPVMTCTVNLPDVIVQEDNVLIKSYSENEGLLEELRRHKIVSRPVEWHNTGHVRVAEVRLLVREDGTMIPYGQVHYGVAKVAEIISRRDNEPIDDCIAHVLEVQRQLFRAAEDGDLDGAYDVLNDELGLEPDYLDDLVMPFI